MSQEEPDDSISSNSENEVKEKSQDLVKFSKNKIFLYDKKCRTVLHLGVLYKNLTKAAANAINLDKIASKIKKMIDKNQIYLRDAGPIILGITKIVVKKTYILFEDIEELTKLRINSKEQILAINKERQDHSKDKDINSKNNLTDLNLKGRQLLGNELKESSGTTALNINSLESDNLNLKNTHLYWFQSITKNKKKNKYLDFTFNKDDIGYGDEDMIRRTIQKMSKLGEKDIIDITSTNKKNNTEIQFDTENKNNNSKTLQNLRDMLFNKNKNKENGKLGNIGNTEIDNKNKDVEGFFTVIKTQIEEPKNQKNLEEIVNDEEGNNDINFNFDININDLQNNDYFNSNIKYNISKNEEMKNNIRPNKNKKKTTYLLKGKLKYDEDIEMEIEESDKKKLNKKQIKELDTKLEKENESKLETMQTDFEIFNFNQDLLTSFNNEKYEYLLPSFLETKDTNNEGGKDNESIIKYIRKEENVGESSSKINIANNSESHNNQSNEKSDITRLNRLTTSNKKRFSISNFESGNKSLLHNLSRLTLNKNDFKGSTSYIEKLRNLNKETEINNIEDDDKNWNINSNFHNDIDLAENYNNLEEEKNSVKYVGDDIKEEEDSILLKEDLEKNVLKTKKNISFTKIRNKLDNKEKFIEPKLFYDLLLMAQKGDIKMTQKKIMDNESINISLTI